MTPVEFRGDLWRQKSTVSGLSCGVVHVILRLAVLVELRLVTDTDSQTQTQTNTCPWRVPRMHSIARYKLIAMATSLERSQSNFTAIIYAHFTNSKNFAKISRVLSEITGLEQTVKTGTSFRR